MEFTFLGTSAGSPTNTRNVTGVALKSASGWDLFDCGEATQHQIMKTPLSLSKLRRVFISHLHGDHCFGLFGLLGSRSMDGSKKPLTVFGPPGLSQMVTTVLELSSTYLNYPLEIHEVSPSGERVLDTPELTIDCLPLTHRVPSYGWSMVEADRPGELDVDAARAAGVPDGPFFGRLKRGETVELDDGTVVYPDSVIGPIRLGRRVIVAGDNNDPASLFERTGGAHVAVHEATFTESVLESIGDDRGHSTAARVAKAATEHGVQNLILTHFSPRYATTDPLRDEAREHFDGGLHMANDFDRFDLAADGVLTGTS